jgi:N-acetylglucosaminyldiphosphoundecaprenol N-acetyl-beta-D-mannosaminyltransferase
VGHIATEDVLSYPVSAVGLSACIESISLSVRGAGECRWLACFNPHSYVMSLEQEAFAKALRDADWLVPDGIGVVLASHLLGGKLRERVTGSDIFRALNTRLNETGARVFLLGASDNTLGIVRAKLEREYPNIQVIGSYAPPHRPSFSENDTEAMIAAINGSGADVLWVGITSPKQDVWLYSNRRRLRVKFAGAVGAVFDFYSGRVKRAHPFFQRLGLEWLERLVREPRRLWRRTFISTPVFVWRVLLERVRLRSNSLLS